VGDQGDVPRDEPATHGLLESPPDDQVDLVHRLRSERGVSVARMEQPVVEGVEVVGTQAPQADVAEGGDDVVPDRCDGSRCGCLLRGRGVCLAATGC
jgi:hypothetical protein